jgi:8-oxo-dGTP pyrophosphatase MutT (NUDIX family)
LAENSKKSQIAFLGGKDKGVFGAKKAEQHSAGGLVVKKKGNRAQVCLVSKKGGRVWAFPKGRVDQGETLKETAVREVLEETGHKAVVLDKLDVIEYYFFLKENNTFYHKTVTFFLMKLVKENAQERDQEADSVGWYDAGVAKKKLSYLNEKKILSKSESLLKLL